MMAVTFAHLGLERIVERISAAFEESPSNRKRAGDKSLRRRFRTLKERKGRCLTQRRDTRKVDSVAIQSKIRSVQAQQFHAAGPDVGKGKKKSGRHLPLHSY